MKKCLCKLLCNAYVLRMSNNNHTEAEFVQFINANSEEVKALATLTAMTESEKLELIKQFMATV